MTATRAISNRSCLWNLLWIDWRRYTYWQNGSVSTGKFGTL